MSSKVFTYASMMMSRRKRGRFSVGTLEMIASTASKTCSIESELASSTLAASAPRMASKLGMCSTAYEPRSEVCWLRR